MARSEEQRIAILSATTALAAERGYPAIDLDGVCARAGVGEGSFRAHFTDTEDAFCAAVAAGTEQLLARALTAFADQSSWRSALRAVAYELRDFLTDDPDRARIMVLESPTACARSRAIREQGMAALAALIDAGRECSADPDSIPPRTAELTAGAVYNRIHTAVLQGSQLSDAMVRELMYTAVRPYLGTEAALAELAAPRPSEQRGDAGACRSPRGR